MLKYLEWDEFLKIGGVQLVFKRSFDIILSLFLLTLAIPLALLIGFSIKISSSGPFLFIQKRFGKDGVLFNIYKFRTMKIDFCEQEEIVVENKLQDEPSLILNIAQLGQLTSIGGFLRTFGLDELPQLLNILRGEMSFVGPRPITVQETKQLSSDQKFYLKVKPGLTCLWQINREDSRRKLEFKLVQDRKYIENWSLWLDTKILIKTLWIILLVFFSINKK